VTVDKHAYQLASTTQYELKRRQGEEGDGDGREDGGWKMEGALRDHHCGIFICTGICFVGWQEGNGLISALFSNQHLFPLWDIGCLREQVSIYDPSSGVWLRALASAGGSACIVIRK
jgi:hypothetical protein